MEQTFWLGREPRARRGPSSAPSHAVEERSGARLVLIADDYPDTRALYVEHLCDAGFRVVEATNGLEAVELATSMRPDAIIMDLSMPGLDGWDATRRIRALSGMRSAYIVALSALDSDISRAMAFDAGCNDFIAKPFLAGALVAVLTVHFRAEDDGTAGD